MTGGARGGALPAEFADLEPFVATWALATEDERSRRRWASRPEDFEVFYRAMLPRLDAVLTYLDRYPLSAIPDEVRPLYYLAIAFGEAAPHVELYGGSAEVPHSFEAHRVAAAHGAKRD